MEEETLLFYDHNFILQQPLTPHNIIEYFAASQFYDRSCLNEILKMQSQFANINISDKITEVAGIYYLLEHHSEGLFVIAKKENNGQKTVILKMYYCIHGYIYCAPTVKGLSNSKVTDSLYFLNIAMDKYMKRKTFNWLAGHQFRTEEKIKDENKNDVKLLFEILHEFELKEKEGRQTVN